eukprot:UN25702
MLFYSTWSFRRLDTLFYGTLESNFHNLGGKLYRGLTMSKEDLDHWKSAQGDQRYVRLSCVTSTSLCKMTASQ